MQDDRRAAMETIAADLQSAGYRVELELIERKPGVVGLTLIEWTAIYIAAEASKAIIAKMAEDALEASKQRLRERRKAKGDSGRHLGVTLHYPDGTEVNWSTRDED